MSMRYRCKGNCKKSYNAHDHRILRQLPLRLQAEFPAYLTYRSAISKEVGALLRICVQNATGPKRFAQILREMHTLKHSRLELQYLDAVSSEARYPSLLSSFGRNKPDVFSKFGDRANYAGYVPSANYLRYVYTSVIEAVRPHMDKQMMLLDGKVLKGDHSFKIVKHIAKVGKEPTFSAMYTVCNEYEEIRMQVLTPTKSLSHLHEPFENLVRSYETYGNALPDIFFTDNVRGDKNFLESMLPSLITNP